jgi:hypothetical protein
MGMLDFLSRRCTQTAPEHERERREAHRKDHRDVGRPLGRLEQADVDEEIRDCGQDERRDRRPEQWFYHQHTLVLDERRPPVKSFTSIGWL